MEIWRVGDGPWGWCSYSTVLALLLCPPVLLSLASLLPHCYKTAAVFQSNTSSFKMRNRRSRKVYLHGCLSLFFRRGIAPSSPYASWARVRSHEQLCTNHWGSRRSDPQAETNHSSSTAGDRPASPETKPLCCLNTNPGSVLGARGPAAGQAVVRPAGVSEHGSVCEQTAIKGEKSPPRFCFL